MKCPDVLLMFIFFFYTYSFVFKIYVYDNYIFCSNENVLKCEKKCHNAERERERDVLGAEQNVFFVLILS